METMATKNEAAQYMRVSKYVLNKFLKEHPEAVSNEFVNLKIIKKWIENQAGLSGGAGE